MPTLNREPPPPPPSLLTHPSADHLAEAALQYRPGRTPTYTGQEGHISLSWPPSRLLSLPLFFPPPFFFSLLSFSPFLALSLSPPLFSLLLPPYSRFTSHCSIQCSNPRYAHCGPSSAHLTRSHQMEGIIGVITLLHTNPTYPLLHRTAAVGVAPLLLAQPPAHLRALGPPDPT